MVDKGNRQILTSCSHTETRWARSHYRFLATKLKRVYDILYKLSFYVDKISLIGSSYLYLMAQLDSLSYKTVRNIQCR
jgi:hypothetical protein